MSRYNQSYEYVDPYKEENDIVREKLKECQQKLRAAQLSERIYIPWVHNLLAKGYEGAEKIRERNKSN